jgi:hypothetical protein
MRAGRAQFLVRRALSVRVPCGDARDAARCGSAPEESPKRPRTAQRADNSVRAATRLPARRGAAGPRFEPGVHARRARVSPSLSPVWVTGRARAAWPHDRDAVARCGRRRSNGVRRRDRTRQRQVPDRRSGPRACRRSQPEPASRRGSTGRRSSNGRSSTTRQSTTSAHPRCPRKTLSSTRRAAECRRRPTARRSCRTDRSLSRRRLTCACWTSSLMASQKSSAGWPKAC